MSSELYPVIASKKYLAFAGLVSLSSARAFSLFSKALVLEAAVVGSSSSSDLLIRSRNHCEDGSLNSQRTAPTIQENIFVS